MEVKYPKVRHYALRNHDQRLLLSCTPQGRRNRPSPCYGTDNSVGTNETSFFSISLNSFYVFCTTIWLRSTLSVCVCVCQNKFLQRMVVQFLLCRLLETNSNVHQNPQHRTYSHAVRNVHGSLWQKYLVVEESLPPFDVPIPKGTLNHLDSQSSLFIHISTSID